HHGHRQGLGDRHRRRPRGRGGRLRHQALPAAGAGGPHAGGPAPPRRRPVGAGAVGRGARGGRRAARPGAPRGRDPGPAGEAAAQGVRAAGGPAGQRRPGADPRHAHRPGVGHRLRGRHQDPRRPREAAPGQGRGGPVVADADRHDPGPRLQVRHASNVGPHATPSASRRLLPSHPMATANGWQPLSPPRRRAGAAAFVMAPFTRLARAHAAAVAGDTLIALALANSLFFDIDPDAARTQVARYLVLTMAPFAVVAPLIGPALDRARGGRRWMVVGASALRAIICVLMIGDLDSMLLFPEAFAVLVLAKSYHVAKSALVPTVVRDDAELVEANSRLSFLSGVITFAAALPGALAFAIAGSQGVLVLATAVFAVGAVLGTRIPPTRVAQDETSETERAELRG